VLTGADGTFCAGANVKTFLDDDPLDARGRSRLGKESFGAIEKCEMPVVAGIEGFCLGGGMELSMYADIRIADEGATFGQPEHNLGLFPGWGGTQRLWYIVGEGRAKEIILTAGQYDATEMHDYGFVTEVVDDARERALELATDIAEGPPVAQALTKELMHAARAPLEEDLESHAFGHIWNTDDLEEGVTAHLDSRAPEFSGE